MSFTYLYGTHRILANLLFSHECGTEENITPGRKVQNEEIKSERTFTGSINQKRYFWYLRRSNFRL
uniref:Uncharacterized protein n=1 Tax=Octopus bimaculoides TaxID=37653 RepID=A0A0L8H7B5_OCTBM